MSAATNSRQNKATVTGREPSGGFTNIGAIMSQAEVIINKQDEIRIDVDNGVILLISVSGNEYDSQIISMTAENAIEVALAITSKANNILGVDHG